MADGLAHRPRILIVDNDPVFRLLAAQTLEAMDYAVESVGDSRSGLEAIEREAPELVLLDLELPGLDGFEACEALRGSAGSEVPVLIATGPTDPETIDLAFRVGANDFIEKPIDWQLLQHRVRFIMRARSAVAELLESQKRLANAQRLARIGHWEWVPGQHEMLWSVEVYRIFDLERRAGGSTYDAFIGLVHPDDREMLDKAMQKAAADGAEVSLDHRITLPSGEQRVIHQQAEAIPDISGSVDCISGTMQDITDRTRAEEQIRYLAYYDILTGLPNRQMLHEHLESVLHAVDEHNNSAVLLLVDLDRFNRVNDTIGHEAGDELLRLAAQRLMSCVRQTDRVGRSSQERLPTVSRLGGCEFSVVLTDLLSSEDAGHVARRVIQTLSEPFTLANEELVLGGSIGIAVYPTDGSDADALLRNAHTALAHAKEAGGSSYRFFSESMNDRALHALRVETNLRSAIDRHVELFLHYQPLINAPSGRVLGAEALVRWSSRELGSLSPAEFIPIAEETGLIAPLGEWVLRTACDQVMAWERSGTPPIEISVNVSSHQLRPAMLEIVQRALSDSGLEASRLELEITESAIIGDDPSVGDTLNGLKELGVRLALDDFGTGYSSLSHLARFPIDTLKIDQSFVKTIGSDEQSDAIIAAVVAMGRRLKLRVVAEGVETEQQREFLEAEGCDVLQGYLLGRPMGADDLAALLRNRGDS